MKSKKTTGEGYLPAYGDLSALNKDGLILTSVGKEQLTDIASFFLDLLQTSSAIYERNGDYALGLFSSGWCRLLDGASRKLCHTESNQEALDSGKWHCHESCWKSASLEAIKKKKEVEIDCEGGIKLYAIPVVANGEVVGAINFGFGDPPTDKQTLAKIAKKYEIPEEKLFEEAKAYTSRPTYIIDFAKQRIIKSAELIGQIIETQQAKEELSKTWSRLKFSEENYRSLFNSIRDAILVTDTERKITQCNQAFTELFGYAATEVTGNDTLVIYEDPEEFKAMGQMIRENIEKPGFLYTITYKKKNGDTFPGETNVFYLKDSQQKITGFIGMVRDVTERKQSEEKLQHSHNLMQYVIEHTKSAIAVHDKDLNYIFVSQRYLDEYKIREKDIIGRHHYDIFPDLPQKWRDVHQKALKGEIASADRDPYERADGTVEWTRWECRPWYENNGSIGGIIVYTEVITDRIKAEDAIIESERKMATLISNLTGMVYRCQNDDAYTMEFLSAGCRNITGYSAEELIDNKHVRYGDLIHPDDAGYVKETIDRSIQQQEPFILEYRIINKNKRLRWVWEQGRAVTDPDNTMHLEGYINDITEKKLLDLELVSMKENLEVQVDEKTKELQEKVVNLERFHQATIEREFRIKELKNEIAQLHKEIEILKS